MDPLAKDYKYDNFTKALSEWCKKVVRTKETVEDTFMSYENIDVDRMKEEVIAIIDEGFPKEKQA